MVFAKGISFISPQCPSGIPVRPLLFIFFFLQFSGRSEGWFLLKHDPSKLVLLFSCMNAISLTNANFFSALDLHDLASMNQDFNLAILNAGNRS
jgi:hypothetical protein